MLGTDEWPTLAMLGICYLVFAGLTLGAGELPLVLVMLGLTLVLVQHSSLQHEVLHGHPFRSTWLSDATVFPALGLLVPYLRFKDTHLIHHHDPNLTDPYDDPETNFLDRLDWLRMPGPVQRVARFNNTLFGRMLVGPAISLAVFYGGDLKQMMRGHRRVWQSYLHHMAGVALVLAWLLTLTSMPLWAYGISAYCAMSVLKIRTFLEHQAHARAAARSVIIEDRGLLALLFLNNNYHSVHHAHPKLVWHQLPRLYRSRCEHYLERNGGYRYRSYGEVFAKYLFRAKDPVAHPLWTLNNRTSPRRLG